MTKREEGKKPPRWEVFALRDSLSEHSDPGSDYTLVHPECSCWKHFLWTVMPLGGVNSRSVHPFFIRIHWRCVEVRCDCLAFPTVQEREALREHQRPWGFLDDNPLCAKKVRCVSHLFFTSVPNAYLQLPLLRHFPGLLQPLSAWRLSLLAVSHPVSFERNLNTLHFPVTCGVNVRSFPEVVFVSLVSPMGEEDIWTILAEVHILAFRKTWPSHLSPRWLPGLMQLTGWGRGVGGRAARLWHGCT